MKYKSKADLIADSEKEWQKLWEQIQWIAPDELEHRWGVGESARSITDHLAHLHAWHRLLLAWIKTGPDGKPDLPSKGYKWNQTRPLNQALYEEFKDHSFLSIRRRLKLSHGRVMKFLRELTDSQLMNPGHYVWTGKLGLASYAGANTASHYRWARKKIAASIKSSKAD